MHELDRIRLALADAATHGEPAVLATVVEVDGSTYRGGGPRLVVRGGGPPPELRHAGAVPRRGARALRERDARARCAHGRSAAEPLRRGDRHGASGGARPRVSARAARRRRAALPRRARAAPPHARAA